MARQARKKRLNRGAIGATFEEVMAKLPAKRRAKIRARADTLLAEVKSLKEMRHAMALTQTRLARSLKTTQNQISRLEQRSDLLLSTLRSYVKALGGELDLVARFPGQPPVTISGLSDLR